MMMGTTKGEFWMMYCCFSFKLGPWVEVVYMRFLSNSFRRGPLRLPLRFCSHVIQSGNRNIWRIGGGGVGTQLPRDGFVGEAQVVAESFLRDASA
jgi:hypothetical protein